MHPATAVGARPLGNTAVCESWFLLPGWRTQTRPIIGLTANATGILFRQQGIRHRWLCHVAGDSAAAVRVKKMVGKEKFENKMSGNIMVVLGRRPFSSRSAPSFRLPSVCSVLSNPRTASSRVHATAPTTGHECSDLGRSKIWGLRSSPQPPQLPPQPGAPHHGESLHLSSLPGAPPLLISHVSNTTAFFL